jgi:hypothetical protein
MQVRLDQFPTLIHSGLDREGPNEFRNGQKQVPLGNMDARADAASGAVTIVVARSVIRSIS